jgi:hypothetical protein
MAALHTTVDLMALKPNDRFVEKVTVSSNSLYLGVEVDDALELSEATDI